MPHLSVPPILIDGLGWKERATKTNSDPCLKPTLVLSIAADPEDVQGGGEQPVQHGDAQADEAAVVAGLTLPDRSYTDDPRLAEL
jgi:hypothetical protein